MYLDMIILKLIGVTAISQQAINIMFCTALCYDGRYGNIFNDLNEPLETKT